MKNFYKAVEDRRSIYGISKEEVVSDEKILEIINHAVTYAPTAFNSQSGRILVLFREHHDRLWDITKETLRRIVPAKKFASTEEKIKSFRSGYGTILFFENQIVVRGLQEKFPSYQETFPIWSQQSSGMLQYIIWTALEAEGLGASLQHYNPLIDDEVKKEWDISQDWKLIAQMPFGKPTAPAAAKEFMPLEGRIKVFK
ncbi:nitroreductase family protein [Alkaliphilus hydrothermalis]|uniref:Oxidoreductase (Fatty acid repression mutant protein) n=1 Tax=Alkaliphilus hydrothermalis TaxID=1482730 RepID=A0ABS2NT21_9FIRM|nr:putative oxidoreductase (fatty acid repression mutant protein) [Alkaliphilus hydrothermalis]